MEKVFWVIKLVFLLLFPEKDDKVIFWYVGSVRKVRNLILILTSPSLTLVCISCRELQGLSRRTASAAPRPAAFQAWGLLPSFSAALPRDTGVGNVAQLGDRQQCT